MYCMVIKLIIASYNKYLSADIKMYYYKIKTNFVNPEMPKAQANKTGEKTGYDTIQYMIFQCD